MLLEAFREYDKICFCSQILRLITLVLLALILFSPIWGDNERLKFSVLCVIGLAIALGFVPAVRVLLLFFFFVES